MNVVFLCLDSLRADYLATMGRNSTIKTPNLDRLASEGVLFENAFGEAQPTIPFRVSMTTGMRNFPWKSGIETRGLWPNVQGWHRVPTEQPVLAELMLNAGYATGLVADTYHMFKATLNFCRGITSWDFIRGQEADPYRAGPLNVAELFRFMPREGIKKHHVDQLTQYLLNMQGRREAGEEGYLSAQVFSSAMRFLDDVRDSQPFYLWVDCFDPHEPWDVPRKYADLYDPDWDEDWEPIFGVQPYHGEAAVRRFFAHYAGLVSFVDKQVGRLLEKLEELGVYDNTLIVAISDHGTELMDHGAIQKITHGNIYRHNAEIMAIMRFPDKAYAGTRVKGLIQGHDFFPTVAGLCGLKHDPVDGMDLMPLITGQRDSLRDYIVSGWQKWASVRTLKHAYTCQYGESPENRDERLFDLEADFGENNNIAGENPDLCGEARERIEGLLGCALPVPVAQNAHWTEMPVRAYLNNSKAGLEYQAHVESAQTPLEVGQ